MAKARTLVGLDVHAAKIVAAVLDAESGELKAFAMTGDVLAAAGFCVRSAAPGQGRVRGRTDRVRTRARAREAARGVRGRCAVEDPARDRRGGQDRSA
jgi:hypothetical protein